MASLSDSTDHRPPSGPTRDPGAPLTGRTLALFAGMVLTGSVTLGLITSAIASLLVPGNQIGLRPYLVSSLPAVLMLFIAIGPGIWCYWFWRQLFPAVERPKRRELPRERREGAAKAAAGAVVPKSGPRPVPSPPDPAVTERATADLLKRREERRRQAEHRRLEERRREEELRREDQRRRVEERRQAEEQRVRAERDRARAEEERRAEVLRRAEERHRRREAGLPAARPAQEEAVPAAAKATPLAALRLPKRVDTTLSRAGIQTVEQLTARTRAEVLELDGIGAKSLQDIVAALDRAGRALRYPQRFSRIS